MKKIGIISPYPDFTALTKTIADEMNIPVVIKEGALSTGLYHARNLIASGNVSAIIARGSTAELLKDSLDFPVVQIDVTNFDLLKAFRKAKEHDDHIVFIDYLRNKDLYELSFIEQLFGISIETHYYINERDIVKIIKQVAKTNASKVIVGTAQCLANTAINQGIKSIVVKSTREAVMTALKRAQEISMLYEEEKLRQKHLQAIISSAFDGVIATDKEGRITVFNEMAASIVGIDPQEVMGKYLSRLQYPFLQKLYGDGSIASKKIVKLGRYKYVVNRIPIEEKSNGIVITFQETEKVMQFNSQLRSELYNRRFYAKHSFEDIICQSEIMRNTIELAKKYSKTDSNILIVGESGTGKELFAQSIHNESPRREGPFIAVNCAAMPENLLESELFGYEEGAFTGAKKGGKPGLFEMAHGGTLFLDEIGELSLNLQSRLLRVLQEKEVMRIGGDRIIPVDVRIISATNRDLQTRIEENQFRLDLFYRLNVLQVTLPPLRERKEDIPLLVNKFLEIHGGPIGVIDEGMMKRLQSYNWPGNVRELENVVQRIIAIGDVSSTDLRQMIFQNGRSVLTERMGSSAIQIRLGTMEEMEKQIIHYLYHLYEGNKQEIANVLNISRTTLWKKLKEIELLYKESC